MLDCGRRGGNLLANGQARESIFLLDFAGLKVDGGVLEFLISDQLADEFPAGVLGVVLLGGLGLEVPGQQLAAFDVHEGGGHDEEFAGDVQVQKAHEVDVFDELGGEVGQIGFINVDFLPF